MSNAQCGIHKARINVGWARLGTSFSLFWSDPPRPLSCEQCWPETFPFTTTDRTCHAEPLRGRLWITEVCGLSSRFRYVLRHRPIIPRGDAQSAAPSGSQRVRYSAQSATLLCANRLHSGDVSSVGMHLDELSPPDNS